MFVVKKRVCVSDTDCTSAMYFTSLMRLVQESFEEIMQSKHPDVFAKFLQQKIALPIVATKAEFLSPIFAGDLLEIHLKIDLKNTSFIVTGDVFHQEEKKGRVEITHVCMDLKEKKKVLSKELFHELLVS